MNTSNLYASAF
ncbi:hypothetical protein A2U01_0009428, partial [Trifolium medium]|nr:hypothetical protein [Trifolium medium]